MSNNYKIMKINATILDSKCAYRIIATYTHILPSYACSISLMDKK